MELLRRMHVLAPTERTKTLCYSAIQRSCNRAQESTRPRRLSVFCDVFIVLILYIYIYFQLYFIFSLVCPYATASKVEPAPRSARALRERRAAGGSAHRSAHTRAHRSACMCPTSACVIAVALTGRRGKRPVIYSARVRILIINRKHPPD